MILIAEKNLNKFGYPVFPIKGRKIAHPYTASYGKQNFLCTNGYMKPENWMIMDILGTRIYHKLYTMEGTDLNYNKKILMMHDSIVYEQSRSGLNQDIIGEIIKAAQQSIDGIFYPASYTAISMFLYGQPTGKLRPFAGMTFTDSELKRQLPFLKKYSSQQIHDMILGTANCKIGMRYPVRSCDARGYINIDFNNYNCPCSFFTLVGVDNAKISSDGHIMERRYEIIFNTFLGHFFIQNAVYSLYTDLIPDKFYDMSDYAQLYYRLLILPYYGKVKNPIRMDEIRQRLDLKTTDTSMLRKIIKRILDELEAKAFIQNPQEITKYGPYMYGYKKNSWKEIIK